MRVSKKAAAMFAAMVSLSAPAFGQQSSVKDGKKSCTPQTRITLTTPSDPAAKMLSGTVVDPNGAVISGVKVTMTNADTKEMRQTSSNDEGRFEFGAVAAGNYSIAIEAANFKSLHIINVKVEKDKLTNVDIFLELSLENVMVGVLAGTPDLIDTPPGTTIISGDIIRRLPLQK
jgi:hypothetical protein